MNKLDDVIDCLEKIGKEIENENNFEQIRELLLEYTSNLKQVIPNSDEAVQKWMGIIITSECE